MGVNATFTAKISYLVLEEGEWNLGNVNGTVLHVGKMVTSATVGNQLQGDDSWADVTFNTTYPQAMSF
jgi:hypothetical protein